MPRTELDSLTPYCGVVKYVKSDRISTTPPSP